MIMWNRDFWKATVERMVRGAAVAIFAVWFGGDVVFDAMNLDTWKDVGALAITGAFGSLLLSIGGNAITKNGPSFTNVETVDHLPPA